MDSDRTKNVDDDLTHHEIVLTRDAYVCIADEPVNVNIHPFAAQIYDWMEQRGQVNYYIESDKKNYPHIFTNPYTFHASTLSQCWQALINEADDFAKGLVSIDRLDIEVRYIRLRSELLINGCRLIEALIKQLLHCTDFSKRDYKNAAIGHLIAFDCKACRKAGKMPHKISMLGSVGHRYGLCFGHEDCINQHIRKLAKQRNDEGSHASTHPFRGLSANDARAAMHRDMMDIGNLVHHVLRHLSDYENRMIAELETNIRLHNSAIVEVRLPLEEWNKLVTDSGVNDVK